MMMGLGTMNPIGQPGQLALAIAAAVVLVLWNSAVGPGAALAQAETAVVTAKLDGRDWTASRVQAGWDAFVSSQFTIHAIHIGEQNERIRLRLLLPSGGALERTYTLGRTRTGSSVGLALDLRRADFMEDRYVLAGEVTIETFDRATRTISGTFSGAAENYAKTRTISVTDGRFASVQVPRIVMMMAPAR